MENFVGREPDRGEKAAFEETSPESMAGAKQEQENGEKAEAALSFPLSLDFEGRHYDGAVTPSNKRGANGMPVYFRVEIGDDLFAYVCCTDNGWRDWYGKHSGNGLVNAIGNYIMEYYE